MVAELLRELAQQEPSVCSRSEGYSLLQRRQCPPRPAQGVLVSSDLVMIIRLDVGRRPRPGTNRLKRFQCLLGSAREAVGASKSERKLQPLLDARFVVIP